MKDTVVLLGYQVVGFMVFGMPIFGIISAAIGIIFAQSKKDEFGVRQLVKLDVLSYRNLLTKAYLIIVLSLTVGVLATPFVSIEIGESLRGLVLFVSMGFMGVLANLLTKRLRYLGWSRLFALVSVVPLVGHVFLVWLAYKPSK